MSRLDEKGPHALVQTPAPVNQYPAFVAYLGLNPVNAAASRPARTPSMLCPTDPRWPRWLARRTSTLQGRPHRPDVLGAGRAATSDHLRAHLFPLASELGVALRGVFEDIDFEVRLVG